MTVGVEWKGVATNVEVPEGCTIERFLGLMFDGMEVADDVLVIDKQNMEALEMNHVLEPYDILMVTPIVGVMYRRVE